MMLEYMKRFERIITASLVVMLAIIVFLATLELGWLIVQDIISPPLFLLETGELLDIFGLFLLVLIGIELLETIKAYLKESVVHVEVGVHPGHDRHREKGDHPRYQGCRCPDPDRHRSHHHCSFGGILVGSSSAPSAVTSGNEPCSRIERAGRSASKPC